VAGAQYRRSGYAACAEVVRLPLYPVRLLLQKYKVLRVPPANSRVSVRQVRKRLVEKRGEGECLPKRRYATVAAQTSVRT